MIIANYHPLALRFFLMRAHYKADVNYLTERWIMHLTVSSTFIRLFKIVKWRSLHFVREHTTIQVPGDVKDLIKKFHACFFESMSVDLHTTAVLDDLMEPLKTINGNLKKFKGKKQQQALIRALLALEKRVKEVLGILGLLPASSFSKELKQLKHFALKRAGISEEELSKKIDERTLARKNKQCEESDRIRKDLTADGIAL